MAVGQIRVVPTRSDAVTEDLKHLRQTTAECYGPYGKAVILQPVAGGHVTATSYSVRVLPLLKPSTPIVQALVASLQEHASCYHGNGLFASLVCTNLALNCMELSFHILTASDVVEYLIRSVVEYIESDLFPCKVTLNWASSHQLKQFIRTQLATRPVCSLTEREMDSIASLLLQAFVNILPQQSEEREQCSVSAVSRVHIYTSVRDAASSSVLLSGVLVEAHFTRQHRRDNKPSSLTVKRNKNGVILTVVFGTSLAGEQKEYLDEVQLEVDVAVAQYAEDYDVQQLLNLAQELVDNDVGFVGCQKCMHPLMREHLEQQSSMLRHIAELHNVSQLLASRYEPGIVVAEKLSAFHVDSVVDTTGGSIVNISSVHLDASYLGSLKDVKIVYLAGKRYLLLEGFNTHSSLMFYCKSNTAAEELKPLCSGIVSNLELGLIRPLLLCGGGCAETVVAHYIQEKWANGTEFVIPEKLLCNKRSFSVLANMVAKVFSSVARSLEHHGGLVLTDSMLHHCWSFPPYDWCLDMAEKNSYFNTSKRCNCGSYMISELPAGTSWLPLHGFYGVADDIIPESIASLLSANNSKSPPDKDFNVFLPPSPAVCDLLEPKIAALRLAGDITSLILRTEFSLQT